MNAIKKTIQEESIFYPMEGFYRVTGDMAKEWLKKWNYVHQRTIRDYHVENLANEMKCGRFRAKTQVNFCKCGEQFFLTNGQHTLRAIAKCGITQVLCVIVTDVDSLDDVAAEYSRHDTHLTRRLSDALVAYELDKELGVTRTQLSTIMAGILYYAYCIKDERRSSHATHDRKVELFGKYANLGKKVLGFTGKHQHNRDKRWAVRKTTMAGMMFTTSKQEHISEEFWTSLFEDDGLKQKDPRKTLLEYIRNSATCGGSGQNSSFKVTPNHILIKCMALAWNAWVDKRELSVLQARYDSAEAEFKLVGTLYPR